ncbi:MAG: hypothetical protein A3G32_02955 [Deltaproteobacteria bacterium RIFCSPLOWO2_12_FULL_40_28]|nr:MAG: hypothetical protein A3C45_01640 [Deltaproteobacteria bacterium RIFCSPHIGHO2_02_FULL_40_28]OGQ19526.1 MAG: hypothetical protein A3E27_02220 [Deltaproteobacteria bacterium RIFCSPHIGHO2_12_FULL_40_32]OGQ40000.1 MAG: hypothetical protein A3I69_08185 [Deltaproteobacteria bacterium RIFCSPLOWO2_02_FULL_40_36]OGQ54327.1 MAG: hypothetical protein A3G32_02955 [Deltaproteobacteria bacterium RIFCSPLOWO2_12_FULL_40_28]
MELLIKKIEGLTGDLVREGLLTSDQLDFAREAQKTYGGNLATILVSKGYITEKELVRRLGKKYGIPVISLKSYKPDSKVITKLDCAHARAWKLIPLFEVEGRITAGVVDPFNLDVIDEARNFFNCDVDVVLASESEMDEALDKYYPTRFHINQPSAELEIIELDEFLDAAPETLNAMQEEAKAAKIVSAVNELIILATKEDASDIHLEPAKDFLKIRLRVDGILSEFKRLDKNMHQAMISRLKILGSMDVAERRQSQDGRFRVRVVGRELDLRLASYPTIYGEAMAIRLFTRDFTLGLSDLGFSDGDRKRFESIVDKPHGIFLVTGPTGSGKTTTLYAALNHMERTTRHVLSVEDPVENEIAGVAQTQINTKAGVTFASTLKAMLREDPDVIMVGEIRDEDTADIAFRAAMTGHLVLSTLHTNDALSSIPRLIEMGMKPYLIASGLLGVLAQRLVRRVCSHCRQEATLNQACVDFLEQFNFSGKTYQGKGCKKCRMTGYKGRIGIFEMVLVDPALRTLINAGASLDVLMNQAKASGMTSLVSDGLDKIAQGITTVDEMRRVVA